MGSDFGAFHRGHEDGAEIVFREELALRVGDFRSANGLVAAVQHQTGDFLDGKLRGQVLGARFGGKTPVFVCIQGSIAVQILEGEAVHDQQRHAGVAERSAARLDDELVAVGFGFLPFGTAGREGQGEETYGQKGKLFFHVFVH